MNESLRGILPAIPTPCDADDRFEEDGFERLAADLYRHGVHGLYVCGATGDAYNLRLEERKKAAEIAVRVSREFHGTVIVHAGTSSTRDSAELAAHAARSGAQAVACMPPANRSFPELKAFYRDVAKAAGIPSLVYHIPHLTGHTLSRDALCELLDIPGVAGIKFSASNLFLLRRLVLGRPGIALFNGDDELLAPALAYGATGGIGLTYNIFPAFFVEIHRAVGAGELARAFAMQNAFTVFLDRVMDFGVFPVLEMYMRERGFASFVRRRPRTVLDPEAAVRFHREVDALAAALEVAGGGVG